jgi:hypothetical protein
MENISDIILMNGTYERKRRNVQSKKYLDDSSADDDFEGQANNKKTRTKYPKSAPISNLESDAGDRSGKWYFPTSLFD